MSADPIKLTGEFYPDTIDPMMDAIRASIINAGAQGTALAELGEQQVVVVDPADSDKDINDKIATAMAKTKGLALLLIAGNATNPQKEAPGPRIQLEIEMQLFVSQRIRSKQAIKPMQFVCEIAKHYHRAEVRISGFPWYENLYFTGFDPLPDQEFTAFAIRFDREFQL